MNGVFELVLLFRKGLSFRTVKIVLTYFPEEYSRKHVIEYNLNVNIIFTPSTIFKNK